MMFVSVIKWPYRVKHGEFCSRALIISKESPSISTSLKPSSKTRLTAVLAAEASTAAMEWGYGIR